MNHGSRSLRGLMKNDFAFVHVTGIYFPFPRTLGVRTILRGHAVETRGSIDRERRAISTLSVTCLYGTFFDIAYIQIDWYKATGLRRSSLCYRSLSIGWHSQASFHNKRGRFTLASRCAVALRQRRQIMHDIKSCPQIQLYSNTSINTSRC